MVNNKTIFLVLVICLGELFIYLVFFFAGIELHVEFSTLKRMNNRFLTGM